MGRLIKELNLNEDIQIADFRLRWEVSQPFRGPSGPAPNDYQIVALLIETP
jgi:hypothetical protein